MMPRSLPATLLALVFALPLSACGDSTSDDTTDAGTGNAGGTSGGAGSEDGGTSNGGATDGGAAGQSAGSAGDGGSETSAGCEGVAPELIKISPSELSTMLEDKDFEFINVHVPYAGEIPDTDAHITYTDTAALESHLGQDLGAKAVLYCLTGPMSDIAGKALVELGYCHIYDMPAGMVGWEAEGYPIDE